MVEHLGTFAGHVIPGTMFLLWGLWWFRGAAPATGPCNTAWEPWVIIPATIAAALGELWWASWRMTDTSVINYQHATMYLSFAVPAIMYLLARRSQVSERLPSLTLGLGFAVAGVLFIAHGSHMAVSGAIHQLLAIQLFVCALISAAEGVRPSRALAVARCWATIATGTWFLIAGWILYRTSYDMNDMAVVMRVHLFFIWNMMASGAVLLFLHLAIRTSGSQSS
ncbi:MAG: transrane protein 45B-like [Gemmatimonadetes bacterium]|nr:transrane protein 45B-like [Gemmatimonadota bacterium]